MSTTVTEELAQKSKEENVQPHVVVQEPMKKKGLSGLFVQESLATENSTMELQLTHIVFLALYCTLCTCDMLAAVVVPYCG